MSGVKGRTRTVTRRGLKDRTRGARNYQSGPDTLKRAHKYLADPIEVLTEAPDDTYCIEEGVPVDDTERPNSRKAYDAWTRFWPRTSEDLRAEEASWAAKSGPCVIKQKARTA